MGFRSVTQYSRRRITGFETIAALKLDLTATHVDGSAHQEADVLWSAIRKHLFGRAVK